MSDNGAVREPGQTRRLAVVFSMVLVVAIVEVVGSVVSGSLALLSDAGHMATDALGLGMALAAIATVQRRGRTAHRTYGLYRLEILAALANAVLLIGIAAYVLFEAVSRLADPGEVTTGVMLVVAVIGLGVNAGGWMLLHRGARQTINLEGALLEVTADLVASLGVVLAAVVISFTGWNVVDPLLGLAIGVYVLPRAWRLGVRALRILVQAAPPGVDLDELASRLAGLPGVVEIHDLHVWTLTTEMEVASVHIVIEDNADFHTALHDARGFFKANYGISHATLQIEPESHTQCTEVAW